jgi:hypothetical protein
MFSLSPIRSLLLSAIFQLTRFIYLWYLQFIFNYEFTLLDVNKAQYFRKRLQKNLTNAKKTHRYLINNTLNTKTLNLQIC